MQNVTRVAKNHSVPVQDADSHETSSAHNRLYISQQVWFQQAVWSKFGPRSAETISLKELERETLSLCTTEKVGEFIVKVNKIVDEKVEQMQGDSVPKAVKKISTDSQCNSKPPDTHNQVAARPLPSTPRDQPTPHRCNIHRELIPLLHGYLHTTDVRQPRRRTTAGQSSCPPTKMFQAVCSAGDAPSRPPQRSTAGASSPPPHHTIWPHRAS